MRRRFTILSFEWWEAADQCAEFKVAQEGEGKITVVAADHATIVWKLQRSVAINRHQPLAGKGGVAIGAQQFANPHRLNLIKLLIECRE